MDDRGSVVRFPGGGKGFFVVQSNQTGSGAPRKGGSLIPSSAETGNKRSCDSSPRYMSFGANTGNFHFACFISMYVRLYLLTLFDSSMPMSTLN
jgi:hypothetical protein